MAAGAAFGGFGGGGAGAAPFADEGQRAGIAEALLAIEAGVVAAPAAAEDAAAVAPLLDQLRAEPADASELAAKFAIFEEYLATVSALREQVLALWAGARDSFDAAPAAAMDRALAKIDDGANLGVADVAGVWLVHGMLKAATRNHAAIAALVRDLETKLRLIADDADCPMCLSSLGEGEGRIPAKVLSCCHKTCRPCWTEWVNLRGERNAFCPLCRNVEFVEAVAELAQQHGVAGAAGAAGAGL
jgi:hypothetical protein